ncbi:MAG: hypothetical protein CML56_01400 [Rhodobacteraceae bacterium]|nr:hypothetical protein [Paracoccaceae bacterium]|tara:strand:+ start:297 stop:509 length:213 start_codon:yes stop_codon:yes gene_type:complete
MIFCVVVTIGEIDGSNITAKLPAYIAFFGAVVSIPAALNYFAILFFARALNKENLRNAAIVWFLFFLHLF